MATDHRGVRWLVVSALLMFVLGGFVCPLITIQLRLFRNWPIGQRLAQSLQSRYPDIEFRGAASYERDVIYVCVYGRMDESSREDLERWVLARKSEWEVTPRIIVRYLPQDIDKELN